MYGCAADATLLRRMCVHLSSGFHTQLSDILPTKILTMFTTLFSTLIDNALPATLCLMFVSTLFRRLVSNSYNPFCNILLRHSCLAPLATHFSPGSITTLLWTRPAYRTRHSSHAFWSTVQWTSITGETLSTWVRLVLRCDLMSTAQAGSVRVFSLRGYTSPCRGKVGKSARK